jgi:DNA-directed RNA polymerase subunit alpha
MERKEYQPLTIPKLSWTASTLTNSFGELVAQPLEPGFGVTLGNALRRTLLGGVEGAAVVAVIVKGVNNEFSSVPGVIEDTMQLVLNTKQIVVRNKTGQPGTMRLLVHGSATATVADIKADEHLELINKDHVIGSVAQDGVLDITFFVESGRGYRPAQWSTESVIDETGKIYLDAMFSPIRQVTYEVEKTRVGRDIDYDKLILSIETDGSESPLDVLHYSVSVLRTQLEHFLHVAEIPFNSMISHQVEEEPKKTIESLEEVLTGLPVEILLKPVDELELSVRAQNCLINAGIMRIIDLVNLSEDEGLKIKNFGRKSLTEVKESMKSLGLSFGMNVKEADVLRALEQMNRKSDHESSER